MIRRRHFIGLAGAAAAATAAESLELVDVHHHILPPSYVAAVGSGAIGGPAGRSTAPEWSVAVSLDTMDRIGIRTALTSISAPGIAVTGAKAPAVARACNDFARRLREDHPGRFGTFAALPLPDVKTSLEEARYALDTLAADGIGLMTSYDGRYLGDPHFAPLFDELQSRKAVVFVHPTPCTCSAGVQTGLAPSAIEYPHETTRTITSLLFSGSLSRCPDVKFIFSHAGGTIPYIAGRIANRRQAQAPDPIGALKRLYFDVALSVNPVTIPALLNFSGPDHIVFGSDFPFASKDAVLTAADLLGRLAQSPDVLRKIARENALSFLPRLRS